MRAITIQLSQLLHQKKLKLAVAESCTGGLLSAELTSLPGASDYFDCGFVTYSNEAKQTILGVSLATLQQYGAVSAETAAAMAKGVLQHSDAHLAVAITGIAGPGGGSNEKPVGLVFIGLAVRNGFFETRQLCFSGDRESIRQQTVESVLYGLINYLSTPSSIVSGKTMK